MDNEMIIAVVGMVAVGIVTGLAIWLTTRNVAGAFVAAIERTGGGSACTAAKTT